MDRRKAIRNLAVLIGASAATTLAIDRLDLLPDRSERSSTKGFAAGEKQLIAEIAELIIPATSTPGAIEAGVPAFIQMMLEDCYREPEQKSFAKGLKEIDRKAKSLGHDFSTLNSKQKNAILAQVEEVSIVYMRDRPKVPSFWHIMKELTLLGYFTSELGMTKALVYVPVPGKLELTKLQPGQKAYSEYLAR